MQLCKLSAKRVASNLATLATLLIMALLMPLCLLATPARAEGGIGMSGSFYRQLYELLPGETLSTPDTFIVVFNTSNRDMNLEMSTQCPAGVELVLDAGKFTLAPHADRKIGITVNVSKEAVPGNYDLVIKAAAVPEGTGIQVTTASQQRAKLTIFGAAGRITIATLVSDGQPLAATIQLYREEDGQELPAGYSETGQFEKRVVPGDYTVRAYYKNTQVAENKFSLAANEVKIINLTARTLYMKGFDVVPYYNNSDSKIAVAEIQYTMENLYQPLTNAEAILQVKFEGSPLEEVSVLSLGTLDTGTISGKYKYVPAEGWKNGNYGFKITVKAAGATYEVMEEEQFKVDNAAEVAKENTPEATSENTSETTSGQTVKSANNNWALTPGILIAILLGIGMCVAVYYGLRRRKA